MDIDSIHLIAHYANANNAMATADLKIEFQGLTFNQIINRPIGHYSVQQSVLDVRSKSHHQSSSAVDSTVNRENHHLRTTVKSSVSVEFPYRFTEPSVRFIEHPYC